jgi:uncharacterized membrane protein YbhN (UPF0104 family)
MPDMTEGIARALQRRFSWNRLAVMIGLVVVAAAVFALFKLLRDIEFEKISTALHATSMQQMLVAGAFTAIGYLALTFYDFFALRTLGRGDIPYRVAALAGFAGYTVGHNLGMTVLTAGVIRLRIYSAWRLTVIDVAKIAFITGVTFWLGNAFVLGAAMVCEPAAATAANTLPPSINRAIGICALLIILGYLFWLLPRPRVVGRAAWQIVLPDARLTVVQIGIGALDLVAGALAIYFLLPAHPSVDFVSLVVIFVTAMLVGFLSHAPGSLGLIELAMLLAMPQFEKEGLLASLLVFRFIYFVLPLILAALLLGIREFCLFSFAARRV